MLFAQLKFDRSFFKFVRLLIVSWFNKLSFGVQVSTRKSFEPYLVFTSRRYFKSGSFSNSKVSEENEDLEPTDKQLAYIKKLGGTPTEGLTRKGASQLIDELKNSKEGQ